MSDAMTEDAALTAAGLGTDELAAWHRDEPKTTGDFSGDSALFSKHWLEGARLVGKLPPAVKRSAAEQQAVRALQARARGSRVAFLREHAETIYAELTDKRTRFVRVKDLLAQAGLRFPGLVPSPQDIAREDDCRQGQKSGLEIDQGFFVSAILGSPRAGTHLCHAMLLPTQQAKDLLPKFQQDNRITLPGGTIERRGKAAILTYENPRYLNAEDQTTIEGFETCVDLALLDPAVEVAVLRGSYVDHPKYKGRRVFGSGINLTHLYNGRIPYVWYLERDLGYVNKLYRGLAFADDAPPDEHGGLTIEKPWIAAVESYAIGGHCQVLLAVDYVIAEDNAYLTLPARKEGIIPGAANMRLPRAVGDRIARQAIQYERRFECDSAEGRLICDEVVPAGAMDSALDTVIAGLTSSGVVSAASNRRAFRITQEPLEMFRQYFAVYAREQAFCHFSPALIANLEKYWNAASRKM